MTVGEHLDELRSRLIIILVSISSFSFVGYLQRDRLLSYLVLPLNDRLVYSSPAGGFDFTLRISILFGIIVSLPVIVYQSIQFLGPVFPGKVKKNVFLIIVSTIILAITGVLIAYVLFVPAALQFLLNFRSKELQSLISAQEYLSFISWYLLSFALLFQLPLILVLINAITKLKFSFLMSQQKFVILVSFILAAILTPSPDVVNQTLMALPIILLYQISIAIIYFINRKNH